ncbi:uncharacterized protein LOC125035167 [Penaeus chinensis]|uniref:uncharacterized protein LOC125035167 n=1 Tax=Penaeus chinensis TaxID=139456 RepID=UPI001FB6D2B6|nr:uncharacterized protein LOC125035167 [Penaeus chinensis]
MTADMKERKSESLFSFKRSNNRYSLHLEKNSKKDDVQLKRASWSSFPLLKFASFDDKGSRELANVKSQSSEDIKRQQNISTPKIGCSFLRGSNASIRSVISNSSSSSSSTSSPSMSSGSSGKSSITSILEGSVSDSHYDSCSTVEDVPYLGVQPQQLLHRDSLSRSTSDVIPFVRHGHIFREERGASSSVPSLFQDEVFVTSPKIIYAHKKTPDVKRKLRKQLVQELEFVKRNGSLPENLEVIQSKLCNEKENVIPRSSSQKHVTKPKSSFRFMQSYKFLSKLENKGNKKSRMQKDKRIEMTESSALYQGGPDVRENPGDNLKAALFENLTSSHSSLLDACEDPSTETVPYSVSAFLASDLVGFEEGDINFGVINEIIEEEEDSECDLSEFMTYAEESYRFERRLEDKLEMLEYREESNEKKNSQGETSEGNVIGNGNIQNLVKRTEMKLNLVKPHNKPLNQVYRSRLLRHISEEPDSGASGGEEEVELRSSPRTPGTPRSPGIDIDDVFKQKQKEIEEGNKDDMSRVRDLTARLKLATRRPSYLDWLNSVQNRSKEIGRVLELHPPKVLEEGVLEEEITDESRKKNLKSALNWLKTELQEMRQQDQQLARQLMQLRIEFQRVRLLRSCNNHQALVDEVRNEAEEARTFESSDLCDVPQDLREAFSPVLREIGVTRMNITSRRFSLRDPWKWLSVPEFTQSPRMTRVHAMPSIIQVYLLYLHIDATTSA